MDNKILLKRGIKEYDPREIRASRWMLELEYYFLDNKVFSQEQKFKITGLHLKGMAIHWFEYWDETNTNHPNRLWFLFKREFIDLFEKFDDYHEDGTYGYKGADDEEGEEDINDDMGLDDEECEEYITDNAGVEEEGSEEDVDGGEDIDNNEEEVDMNGRSDDIGDQFSVLADFHGYLIQESVESISEEVQPEWVPTGIEVISKDVVVSKLEPTFWKIAKTRDGNKALELCIEDSHSSLMEETIEEKGHVGSQIPIQQKGIIEAHGISIRKHASKNIPSNIGYKEIVETNEGNGNLVHWRKPRNPEGTTILIVSFVNKVQHTWMKKKVARSEKQLQEEEEKKTKVQRNKALAKLEELNKQNSGSNPCFEGEGGWRHHPSFNWGHSTRSSYCRRLKVDIG